MNLTTLYQSDSVIAMILDCQDEIARNEHCQEAERSEEVDQEAPEIDDIQREEEDDDKEHPPNSPVDSTPPRRFSVNNNGSNQERSFFGIDAELVLPGSSHSSNVSMFSYEARLWEYRNEGNQNLTISSYVLRKVLRLRKASPARCHSGDGKHVVMIPSNPVIPPVCGDGCALRTPTAVVRGHEFARTVMLPLLTPPNERFPWVQPGELVFISPETVSELATDVQNSRPTYRLHRSLDPSNFYATVAPDVTNFSSRIDSNHPVFSFEIKPKRGFCTSKHLWDGCSEKVPAFICRYCLKQTAYAVSASTVPNYCPLRLFSGDEVEMTKAVKSLLTYPRNNLKLFVDGKRVPFGGKHSTCPLTEDKWMDYLRNALGDENEEKEGLFLDWISRLLILALTDDGMKKSDIINGTTPFPHPVGVKKLQNGQTEKEGQQGPIRCAGKAFFSTQSHLPPKSILGRLLAVQMLDKDGPAECQQALKKLRSGSLSSLETTLGSGPFSCPLWTRAVGCALGELDQLGVPKESPPWDVVPNDTELSLVLEKIMRFQVSASSSDCSVFCTFQRIPGGVKSVEGILAQQDETVVLEMDGVSYACRISIVDVDPKPPSHIEKYIEDTKRGFAALVERGWLQAA